MKVKTWRRNEEETNLSTNSFLFSRSEVFPEIASLEEEGKDVVHTSMVACDGHLLSAT